MPDISGGSAIVTVGVCIYPTPGLVTLTALTIFPLVIVATAVALASESVSVFIPALLPILTVGIKEEEYPYPWLVRVIEVTIPAVIDAIPTAVDPIPTPITGGGQIVTGGA